MVRAVVEPAHNTRVRSDRIDREKDESLYGNGDLAFVTRRIAPRTPMQGARTTRSPLNSSVDRASRAESMGKIHGRIHADQRTSSPAPHARMSRVNVKRERKSGLRSEQHEGFVADRENIAVLE